MKSIMKAAQILSDINSKIYNFSSHIIILIIWITILGLSFSNPSLFFVKYWIISGIVLWVVLMIYRFGSSGVNILKDLKEMWSDPDINGPLSFLVGFNLCVVLSLVSLPVMLIFTLAIKEEHRQQNKREQGK